MECYGDSVCCNMLYHTTYKYYTFNQAIIKQIAVVVSGVLTEDNHYLNGENDHAARGNPPAANEIVNAISSKTNEIQKKKTLSSERNHHATAND